MPILQLHLLPVLSSISDFGGILFDQLVVKGPVSYQFLKHSNPCLVQEVVFIFLGYSLKRAYHLLSNIRFKDLVVLQQDMSGLLQLLNYFDYFLLSPLLDDNVGQQAVFLLPLHVAQNLIPQRLLVFNWLLVWLDYTLGNNLRFCVLKKKVFPCSMNFLGLRLLMLVRGTSKPPLVLRIMSMVLSEEKFSSTYSRFST